MLQNLKNEYSEVSYEVEYWEDKKILYSNWIGSYLEVEQVKAGALLGLEHLKLHKTALFLNDNRQLEGVWDEANEWIAEVWMPQAIAAGLKKFAHILPKDIFGQLSAEFMRENSKKSEAAFQMRLFNNQEEAEAWLLS